jgi:hypothetical protein
MNDYEHVFAVVEPVATDDPSLDAASEVVGRGGRATVVLLLTKRVKENIRAFAAAEDLTFADAREIALERMKESYGLRVGGPDTQVVASESTITGHAVFDAAAKANASSVIVPGYIADQRGWRREVEKSQVPVVITPARAA